MKGIWDNVAGTFSNAATFSKGVVIPEMVFAAFQATFAGITACLIIGAFAERVKFSAVLAFLALWFTFSYLPIAHMVWFWAGPDAYTSADVVDKVNSTAGYIWQMGALDFAGGTVVHINAAVAGLVGAYMVGKRIGYGREAFTPHSLTLTMVGASLLWVGWFGFNAGSALEANGFAALAFINTFALSFTSPHRTRPPRCRWSEQKKKWGAEGGGGRADEARTPSRDSSGIGRHAGESLHHTAERGEGGGRGGSEKGEMSHCSDPGSASGWGSEMKEGGRGRPGTAKYAGISRTMFGAMRGNGCDLKEIDTLSANARGT
jgi:Amt family ammonium transporter